ncbi:MAG TPA: nuclease A inhibitor family protein [Pyrinomonadaceae bacterium]|jgi:hypothetical protein
MATDSDEQILKALKAAAKGLLFMSETDAPFAPVSWSHEGELTPDAVRELTKHDAATPVEVVSADDFFRAAVSEPDWKGPEELATARRFQTLLRLLHEKLADPRAYRVGKIELDVYVVGRAPSGKWLGLSTRVVET